MNFKKLEDWQKGAIIGFIWGVFGLFNAWIAFGTGFAENGYEYLCNAQTGCWDFSEYGINTCIDFQGPISKIIMFPVLLSICTFGISPMASMLILGVSALIGSIIIPIIAHLFGKPIKKILK